MTLTSGECAYAGCLQGRSVDAVLVTLPLGHIGLGSSVETLLYSLFVRCRDRKMMSLQSKDKAMKRWSRRVGKWMEVKHSRYLQSNFVPWYCNAKDVKRMLP